MENHKNRDEIYFESKKEVKSLVVGQWICTAATLTGTGSITIVNALEVVKNPANPWPYIFGSAFFLLTGGIVVMSKAFGDNTEDYRQEIERDLRRSNRSSGPTLG